MDWVVLGLMIRMRKGAIAGLLIVNKGNGTLSGTITARAKGVLDHVQVHCTKGKSKTALVWLQQKKGVIYTKGRE